MILWLIDFFELMDCCLNQYFTNTLFTDYNETFLDKLIQNEWNKIAGVCSAETDQQVAVL